MVRNEFILTSKKIDTLCDFNILYCNFQNCPINSMYQCRYCKKYYCFGHSNIIDKELSVCNDCISDNNIRNIYKALKEIQSKNNCRNNIINFFSINS